MKTTNDELLAVMEAARQKVLQEYKGLNAWSLEARVGAAIRKAILTHLKLGESYI